MEAKDLRIGNRILRAGYLHEEKDKFHEIIVGHNDIVACVVNPDGFKPIPLTEDWLKRFGFVYEKGEWALDEIRLSLDGSKWDLVLQNEEWERYPLGIRPRFVHDIQNLCLDLLGKELTYE